MPLTNGQANAVATILRWVGYRELHGGGRVPTDEQAADALVALGIAAGKQLQLGYGEARIRAAVAKRADDLLDLEWRHARLGAGFRVAQGKIHFPHYGQLDDCQHTECIQSRQWLMSREQLAEEVARDAA